MSVAPKPLQLRKEDYREAPTWVARLFQQLNLWLDPATTALSSGLTRADNLQSEVKAVTFTVSADPIVVKAARRPSAAWVSRLERSDGALIASPWSFTWSADSSGNLQARFQGLTTGVKYKASIILE